MQMVVSDEDSQFYSLPTVDIGKEEIDPLRDLKVAEVLRKRGMEDVSVLWSFGQKGDGKIKFPQSIATNTSGGFIVADSGDRKIKVFDRRGNFLKSFRCLTDDVEHETIDLDTDGAGNVYLLVIENGMYVRALAVDRESGDVLVLEREIGTKCNAVVDVYGQSKDGGHFVRSFDERYLSDAVDIAAAGDGRIFVLDSSFNGDQKSISVFNGDGERLSEFQVVPNVVAVSFHRGDSSVVVASLPFHVESVKRRAKISLYPVSGNHWRAIDH